MAIPTALEFQTPDWCCEYMVSLLPEKARIILEPTPGIGNLVRAIQHSKRVPIMYSSFEETRWDVSYDAVVMNPPFSPMANGYAILDECMQHVSIIIALMPWLVLINSQRRTAKLKDFGLVSVTHLPRSTFKGARIQACVLYLDKAHKERTELKFVNQPKPINTKGVSL